MPKEAVVFQIGDVIKVTYVSRIFQINEQLGTIVNINPIEVLPYMVSMHDKDKKIVNAGHDNKGGGPGTGPYIFVSLSNLTLVEKYVPKFTGDFTKPDIFRVGDAFIVRDDLDLTINNDPNEQIGVTENQLARMRGSTHTISEILHIPEINLRLAVDATYNYTWKPGWIRKVEIPLPPTPADTSKPAEGKKDIYEEKLKEVQEQIMNLDEDAIKKAVEQSIIGKVKASAKKAPPRRKNAFYTDDPPNPYRSN